MGGSVQQKNAALRFPTVTMRLPAVWMLQALNPGWNLNQFIKENPPKP